MKPQESYCSIQMPVADGVFTRFFSQKSLNTNATIDMADSGDSAYQTSCSFTGKEKDPETGYSYFGARYLDHELMTTWLSVDPMSDKYPSISPYAYCAWNPVKLVDPEGEDVYRLDTETGSLILEKKTKKKYDIIIAGKIQGIGPAKKFVQESQLIFSKGILNGGKDQDISQTGFETCSNLQEEALKVAVYISFSCNKELSGVGYNGVFNNQDISVFAWSDNTDHSSENPLFFRPRHGGTMSFHFHIHCGKKDGGFGYSNPSDSDFQSASVMKQNYKINTFVLISRKEGSVLFNEKNRISPYIGVLPKTVHSNYNKLIIK